MDQGSKLVGNRDSIGNVNTSNALVDPESNKKEKRETSFKSQKSNKSNNSSKQDVIREKDINLEIVGEEDKEDDPSINVPGQYEQEYEEEEDEESDEEEEEEQ